MIPNPKPVTFARELPPDPRLPRKYGSLQIPDPHLGLMDVPLRQTAEAVEHTRCSAGTLKHPICSLRARLAIGQGGNFSQAQQALVRCDQCQAKHLGRRS